MIIGNTKFKEKKATIPKLVSSCCHQNWNSPKNLKMEDFNLSQCLLSRDQLEKSPIK